MSDTDTHQRIVEFLEQFSAAMDLGAGIQAEPREEGLRINLTGENVEILVRHRGEPIKALQHIVDTGFGRRLGDNERVFIDGLDYRRGKDVELQKMARLLAEKVKQTGADQQIGPLNPYERRLVHLAVAEVAGVTTESVGDAFSKTVYISLRK